MDPGDIRKDAVSIPLNVFLKLPAGFACPRRRFAFPGTSCSNSASSPAKTAESFGNLCNR